MEAKHPFVAEISLLAHKWLQFRLLQKKRKTSRSCICCVLYAYFIPYAYGTYRTRTVCTIRVWYVFLYHTRMVVPYAYTVSHSIKLSIGTGGSIPNAYNIITLKRLCPS